MSTIFCGGSRWKSSTEPSEESEVEEAEAVGESFGEPMVELVAVEGEDSAVMDRLKAARCGKAVVVLIVAKRVRM